MHPLDNPVWHALSGPQSTVAEGGSLAARYDPAVAPFAALPDEPKSNAWDALRELVGSNGVAVFFRVDMSIPDGWSELFSIPTVQMVATSVEAVPAPDAHPLGPTDVSDMLALVEKTEPGPFLTRTVELGHYLGIRHRGALVAMAGERMRLPGYTEISAVCTDPAHRGQGLATRLVHDLVGRIRARGDRPILHAVDHNVNALRLYETLGFTRRQQFNVTGLRAPA